MRKEGDPGFIEGDSGLDIAGDGGTVLIRH